MTTVLYGFHYCGSEEGRIEEFEVVEEKEDRYLLRVEGSHYSQHLLKNSMQVYSIEFFETYEQALREKLIHFTAVIEYNSAKISKLKKINAENRKIIAKTKKELEEIKSE